MNILHVTTVGEQSLLAGKALQGDFGGGIAASVIDMSSYQRELGNASTIVCCYDCEFVSNASLHDIPIFTVKAKWVNVFGRPVFVRLSIRDIVEVIRSSEINVVHAHNFAAALWAGVAASFCGKPMIISVHQDITDYSSYSKKLLVRGLNVIRRKFLKSLYSISCRLAYKVVCVSEFVKTTLGDNGYRLDNVVVVHNGVRPTVSDFSDDGFRKEMMLGPDIEIISVIGRLKRPKGVEYLLRAMPVVLKRNPKVHLCVVGEGDDKPRLSEIVDELGLRDKVTFTGFRDDPRRVLSSTTLYVIPSLTEGLPISLIEAVLSEVPAIASDIPACREVLEDGITGFLVEPENSEILAEKINFVLQNKSMSREMARLGLSKGLSHFSLEAQIKKLNRIYSDGLTSRP